MAYKALYRKYRPNNFSEVIGQKHVVETLKNAVNNDKLAHAYLFCGPRGTGKTTVAKILAKSIAITSSPFCRVAVVPDDCCGCVVIGFPKISIPKSILKKIIV